MSLSYRHQQLVYYQLSKPESLVKEMQTAKCIYAFYLLMLIHAHRLPMQGKRVAVQRLTCRGLFST